MVSRMACRSFGGGRPTYKVLSRRPGLSTAGSMISAERKQDNTTCTLIELNLIYTVKDLRVETNTKLKTKLVVLHTMH